ncbi:hypothetical protein JSO60_06655 [Riemerella anatipestifer]|uniref:hypothetical protein n=1 Tax=Riemerella anatipestifer TaxID=34085 RepID=UPI0030C35BE6
MKRLLLFFGFVLSLVSCREENRTSRSDCDFRCTYKDFEYYVTYKVNGESLETISVTEKKPVDSGYYGSRCSEYKMKYRLPSFEKDDKKQNGDGTITERLRERVIICK